MSYIQSIKIKILIFSSCFIFCNSIYTVPVLRIHVVVNFIYPNSWLSKQACQQNCSAHKVCLRHGISELIMNSLSTPQCIWDINYFYSKSVTQVRSDKKSTRVWWHTCLFSHAQTCLVYAHLNFSLILHVKLWFCTQIHFILCVHTLCLFLFKRFGFWVNVSKRSLTIKLTINLYLDLHYTRLVLWCIRKTHRVNLIAICLN